MFRSKEEQFDFYWKEIFTGLAYNPIEFNTYRFDQTMSLPGKVNKLYDMFKVLAMNNQEVMDYLKVFVETFDGKLYETMDDILSKWLEDGILTELIRNAINEEVVEARNDYSTLKERLDSEKADVDTQLSQIAINVKNFGAVGDGLTDDTQSFFNAITYCLDINSPLYIPSGTYILGSSKLYFKLNGKSFTMFGDGSNTILKRKDDSISNDWERLFSFTTGNESVRKINLYDFKIDSNARMNPLPEDVGGYYYEHNADFHFAGSPSINAYIELINVQNVEGHDAIADHFYIAGVADSGVKHANFTNTTFTGRTRERGDITITGAMDSCNINNFKGALIEVELNAIRDSDDSFSLNITNSVATKRIKITAIKTQATITNSSMHNLLVSGNSTELKVSNSYIYVGYQKDMRMFYSGDISFNNVNFIFNVDDVSGVRPIPLNGSNQDHSITFDTCDFNIDSKLEVNQTIEGSFIVSNQTNPNTRTLKMTNCVFDERIDTALVLDRSDTTVFENVVAGGKSYFLDVTSSSTRPVKLSINGGDFSKVGSMFFLRGGNSLEIKLSNIHENISQKEISYTSSNVESVVPIGNRKFYTTETPTGSGLRGDVVINQNLTESNILEWTSTNTHRTANWVVSKTIIDS